MRFNYRGLILDLYLFFIKKYIIIFIENKRESENYANKRKNKNYRGWLF